MFAGTVAGKLLPVYIVCKAENLWTTWTENPARRARYNCSCCGWIDDVCFLDWFKTIALPFCQRKGGHFVLIGDNLSSRFLEEVLKMCMRAQYHFLLLATQFNTYVSAS